MQQTKLANWEQVPFTKVNIADTFWRPRMEVLQNVTLKACFEKCETTGRIANFAKAAGLMEGKFEGIYFDDSDVYKVIEGAAYSLMTTPDPALEEKIDRIVDWIAAAQEEDGYLCTYFTLEAPDKKWTDMEKHEMYCGGHLMEAAVAYYEATGKRKLLDVACKLADHYDSIFGPGKRHWVEGHEEIELALLKLYRITGEERYLHLSEWLLEERGHGHGVGMIWEKEDWGPAYCQDDVPVKEIKTVKGHAVRAMYLYTAMADVARAKNSDSYLPALLSVWENVVHKNMYITGGIGPTHQNEGFTEDYDLPNESAYCETCAAIGMVLWNQRMNLLFGDAKYADVIERAMYNGVLSGLSHSGDKFFYVNPLASNGGHHRKSWYNVSCCPTNLARFIPSIGNYIYAKSNDGLAVNLYVNGTSEVVVRENNVVQIEQKTEYPWNGKVGLVITPDVTDEFSVKLRIPSWCKSYQVLVNGAKTDILSYEKGYLNLRRVWEKGDIIELLLDMPVKVVRAHPLVQANIGHIAIQRGPIVYCLEEVDNHHLQYGNIELSSDTQFQVKYQKDLLDGAITLTTTSAGDESYTFIPYYIWDNRDPGFMQVWLRERETDALYR
ncbi:glycoside hydrolase family 127 protein [Lederbergia graminis]|uniref:Glycoside hydrolase family 127 protein n=1 Tax=Lederbergia graminis TaxID=735518 RepID=A0ABW0LKV4_9BACI